MPIGTSLAPPPTTTGAWDSATPPSPRWWRNSTGRKALGHRFMLRFAYVDGDLRDPVTGKYEEFVCELA